MDSAPESHYAAAAALQDAVDAKALRALHQLGAADVAPALGLGGER